jgi:sarcosine oxidase
MPFAPPVTTATLSRSTIPGYDTSHVTKSYDVVVVGAGVFGAWTAYHLVRAGMRVLIADQYAPGNTRSSSGGETRVIRMSYGADEIYTRSAIRSLKMWKRFSAETGRQLFHRTGVVLTGAADDPYLLNTRDVLDGAGVKFEWLRAAEARRRFPQIELDREAAIYEPGSGALMARRAVQAVIEAAVASGARYETRRVDASATLPSATLPSATLPSTTLPAKTVVFACGPWLPKLFPDLLRGRIRPTRQPVFFFGTPAGKQMQMPIWIAFREGAYSIPALDGRGFKLALDEHGSAFEPDTGDRHISAAELRRARAILAKRFPALKNAPLLESRVCQYENTSNGDFLIDRHPEHENVWLVGGGSGHGFKHGPAVGEYVAGQILGKRASEPRFLLASKKATRERMVF